MSDARPPTVSLMPSLAARKMVWFSANRSARPVTDPVSLGRPGTKHACGHGYDRVAPE
jgi:hypothetical protein